MIDADYDYGFYGDWTTSASGWIFDLFYGFKSNYILEEVPNITCKVPVIVDEEEHTLFSGFIGMSVTSAGQIDHNYEYKLTGNDKLLKKYHKKLEKEKLENDQSESDLDNESDSDSNGDQQDHQYDSESDEEEITRYHYDAISRAQNCATNTLYDYRPVLACYFTNKKI